MSGNRLLLAVDSSEVADDVDGCEDDVGGCAHMSESIGDLMTELSLSDSSSIKACTFEKTPRRAKLSKNSLPVFSIISSKMFSTTKCPSSSSYKQSSMIYQKLNSKAVQNR